MRISQLFIIMLFIVALTNGLQADQTINETEGADADPECDYISVPEIL